MSSKETTCAKSYHNFLNKVGHNHIRDGNLLKCGQKEELVLKAVITSWIKLDETRCGMEVDSNVL